MKKRILSTLLALLMIVTLLPLGLVEPAEAAETLDCTVGVAAGKINPAYTGYVNRAMRYYIRNVSALSNVPDGQSILFFFEGVSAVASPDYKADDYTKSAVRNAAVCLAVKFVNGTPEIYYCEDQCSTFPDMPLEFSYKANGYSPSTIYDGIYKVRLDNHLSGSKEDYAALTLDMSNNYLTGAKTNAFYLCDNDKRGTGKPFTNSQITSGNRSYQIHGHAGKTTTQADSFRWSVGCILAGATYGEFSALMAGITGDSSLSSTGKPPLLSEGQKRDFGYVVIDRSQYMTQLQKIYTGSGSYTKGRTTAYYNITSEDAQDAIHELCKGSLGIDSGGGTTEDVIGSGNCGANGANVTWKLTSDGTLTISGTGKMADYGWEETPWYGLRLQVKKAIIKDGVTNIGDYAFDNCTKLTRAEIPDSVTNIGAYAFHMCDALKTLTIPKSVTWIAEGAFSVSNISINVAAENRNYCIEDGVLYDKEKTILIYVGSLAKEFFTIPGSVTRIALWAFFGCTSLTNITIPKSVTCISRKAFYCCDSLANVYYDGTEADWAKIVIAEDNEDLTNAKLHAATIFTPANVELVGANAVSGGIQVTWKEAAGAVTYKVYRKDAANTKWTALTTTATGTSYVDKTAVAGVTYTYTVRGVASDGKTLSPSYNKTGVSATMPKPVSRPANVTLVSAKAVNGGIQVTWQAAAGAAQYRVYRKDAANPKWTVLTSSATGTSYVDKTAKAGVKYTYTVRGINKDGVLSPSYDGHGVSATIPKTNAPANVTLTGAKVVTGGIQVTWKAASGATKYRVYRKDATNTGWKALTSSATGTSFLDKTAVAGVTYTYTVRGIASDGKTLSSSYDKIGVSAVIKPAKVVLISAKADSAGVLVTWQKAAGAHSYQVFRKTANTGWQRIAKNIHDTEWKDIDAVKGTKYIYTVRAVADDGTTRGAYDKTGKTATVTKNPTTPADVTLGKAVAGKSGITVTWSYAVDARMYRVYRKAAGETKWTIVAKNATGKSWTDTNVTKGTTYTYTVRGVNANGKLSPGYNKTGVSTVAK